MFKQLLLIIIIFILSYSIIKYILFVYFHKIYLSKNIIKYPINDSDKKFLNLYSNDTILENLNKDNINLFYTDSYWSMRNNNYILNIKTNRYYIIDSGYYYYLPNMDNYKIIINNKDLKIKLFDLKNIKKINS
jgi:hypothetical protein